MSGIDIAILSSMAREQMEKEAAIGKAYQKGVEAAGKWLAPRWGQVGKAGKWLGTAGGRIGPETGALGQAAVHGGRVAAGAGLGAAAGALGSEDKKKGALMGAVAGGLGAGVLPYALKTLHQTGVGTAKMVSRPVHTSREAWRGMSHTLSKAEKAKLSPEMLAQVEKAEKELVQRAGAAPGWWTKTKAWAKGITPEEQAAKQTQHLVQGGKVRAPVGWGEAYRSGQGITGKARELAGEASRRGWTGKGGVTKYLPGGGKALTAAFAGMSAPTVYRSATGDIPLSEGLGEIGSNIGYLAAGAVPGGTFMTPLLMGEIAGRGLKAPAQWFENQGKKLKVPDALRQQYEAQRGRLGKVLPQAIQQAPQAIAKEVQR
jgi:hypothetical protein